MPLASSGIIAEMLDTAGEEVQLARKLTQAIFNNDEIPADQDELHLKPL